MEDVMVELPIEEAKAIGSKTYYTQKPCLRGHTTFRRVKGGCVECQKIRDSRRKDDPLKLKIGQSKANAKVRDIEHNLTSYEDIEWPSVCPVLGIRLDYNAHRSSDNSPQIDRVDNSKGYTRDNVKVISRRANILKSDATLDELKAIVNYVSRETHTHTSSST